MNITPTEDDIFAALRSFLQNVLPPVDSATGFVVVVGQENRVPEPKGSNYIVFWPLRMPRLSTNNEALISAGLEATYSQKSQCVIQLDVHGPEAFNNATIISTMFRSSYATDYFTSNFGSNIAPLFADDPRQAQFVSGEQQYEDRYIVEANLQVKQTVTTPAQSATSLDVGITDVETNPASWPNSIATAP